MQQKGVQYEKTICVFIAMAMLISPLFSSAALQNTSAAEDMANMYHTELVTYFESHGGYPDHYGGSYIKPVSRNLVINVTERTPDIEAVYYEVTGAEKLEFQVVEYSLNELFAIAGKASSHLRKSSSPLDFKAYAIIQKNNQVEIWTDGSDITAYSSSYNINNSKEKLFFGSGLEKNDLDAVVFKQAGDLMLESAAEGPGYGINKSGIDGSTEASVGYLAGRNTGGTVETGFVTAGHFAYNGSVNGGRVIYDSSGQRIGVSTLTVGRPDNEINGTGDFDFSFIKLDNGVTMSPTVRLFGYPQDAYTQNYVPGEGSFIYKSGAATGLTTGYVFSIYFNTDTDYMTGPRVKRILSTYNYRESDSGGIVFASGAGTAKVIGIHQGRYPVEGTVYAVTVSAYNIQNEYGIVAGY